LCNSVVQIFNINHGEHKGNHEGTRRILWTNIKIERD
jgi:hypothetical protein